MFDRPRSIDVNRPYSGSDGNLGRRGPLHFAANGAPSTEPRSVHVFDETKRGASQVRARLSYLPVCTCLAGTINLGRRHA
jgi:hypothetical protein